MQQHERRVVGERDGHDELRRIQNEPTGVAFFARTRGAEEPGCAFIEETASFELLTDPQTKARRRLVRFLSD